MNAGEGPDAPSARQFLPQGQAGLAPMCGRIVFLACVHKAFCFGHKSA